MFMRRVCIHARVPYFDVLRFYEIKHRKSPLLGLEVLIMHIYTYIYVYVCMYVCVCVCVCVSLCFYMWCGIRIVLICFTGHGEYVLFYCGLYMTSWICIVCMPIFVVCYLLVLGQKLPNKYVQNHTGFRTRKGGWGFWLLPWRWHILSIPLKAGRWISAITCGLDDVFPPDDLGSGPYTPFNMYISDVIATFLVIEINSF